VAENAHFPRGLGDQRADDPDGCGFAGAIGTQQGIEVALRHVQTDTLQRLKAVGIGFFQVFNGQRVDHREVDRPRSVNLQV